MAEYSPMTAAAPPETSPGSGRNADGLGGSEELEAERGGCALKGGQFALWFLVFEGLGAVVYPGLALGEHTVDQAGQVACAVFAG